jgi:hypothetical protein
MTVAQWEVMVCRSFNKANISAPAQRALLTEEKYLDVDDVKVLGEVFVDMVTRVRGTGRFDPSEYRMRIRVPGSTVWGWYGVDRAGRAQVKR